MTIIRQLQQTGLALALGGLFAISAQAQEVVLKLHHIWPTVAMGHNRVAVPWCDDIAKESNNRMRCQILPAMSGGGTPGQLVDRVKDGVDDLVMTLPGYTPGRFPIMEALELPFMTNTAEVASAAAWDYYSKYATKEFPGTKILATWVHDEGFVSTSGKPVRALDDFKGLKIRAASRQSTKLLAKLGATPVGMPIPGVADAMTKGTIDGFLTAWEIIPSFKLQEVSKFHTEIEPSRPSMFTAGFVFAMNQAKYDSLPPDLKRIIDKHSGAGLSRTIGRYWDEATAVGRKAAQDRGNTFIKVSPAETDRWMQVSAPLYDEWVGDMDKKGLPGKQMLQDAQDLIKKYSAAK
ncbi:MAG: putative periplasmic component [Pseudomonadota bacterium]|jgi:TRAP-type C4-dicarboxylate transport system substrate-binding protein